MDFGLRRRWQRRSQPPRVSAAHSGRDVKRGAAGMLSQRRTPIGNEPDDGNQAPALVRGVVFTEMTGLIMPLSRFLINMDSHLRTVRKAGKPLVITVLKAFAERNHLREGARVNVRFLRKKMTVESRTRPHYTLAELMAEMPQGLPWVEDWDEMHPVGLEKGWRREERSAKRPQRSEQRGRCGQDLPADFGLMHPCRRYSSSLDVDWARVQRASAAISAVERPGSTCLAEDQCRSFSGAGRREDVPCPAAPSAAPSERLF